MQPDEAPGTEVRERGEAARECLGGLRLAVHPDKYRVLRSASAELGRAPGGALGLNPRRVPRKH